MDTIERPSPAWDPRAAFAAGLVIPALPLALHEDRSFDPVSQRALLRYYVDADAGGIAVGVHSTQFEIRDIPGFYDELLRLAADTVDAWAARSGRSLVKIAGICGNRDQAVEEAQLAARSGYHAGLLALTALHGAPTDALIAHARAVSEVLPIIGFYLQPAVGGMVLHREFWRGLASLPNVWGIKMAPFDRYATLEVIRGVAEAEAADRDTSHRVALYTGNDDAIVIDLLTEFPAGLAGAPSRFIAGGLLGHWGVWTARAAEVFERCRGMRAVGCAIPPDLLRLAAEVTDMNGAVFDAANGFAGCLPGINEVLRRQGLVESAVCLDPSLALSPGQAEEITRVCAAYPHLTDDAFVTEHLSLWRS